MIFISPRSSNRRFSCFLFVCSFSASLLFGNAALQRAFAQEDQPSAAGKKDSKTYVLKRIYKKGETSRYAAKMNSTMASKNGKEPEETSGQFETKEYVKEANKDGSFTVSLEFVSAKMRMNNAEIDIVSKFPLITAKCDILGNISTTTDGGDPQFATFFKSIGGLTNTDNSFPKKPVKIGEEWEKSERISSQDGKSDVETETIYRLLVAESLDGLKALKVISHSTTQGGDNSKDENTNWYEEKTGKLIKMVSSGKSGSPGNETTTTITVKYIQPNRKGQ